jgi:hypothetical protein
MRVLLEPYVDSVVKVLLLWRVTKALQKVANHTCNALGGVKIYSFSLTNACTCMWVHPSAPRKTVILLCTDMISPDDFEATRTG